MMGEFSFGYIQKGCIAYSWELITSPEWYGIPKERLYVTVFGGAEVSAGRRLGVDQEAKEILAGAGHVAAERIFAISWVERQFLWPWEIAVPAGRAAELHFDMGSRGFKTKGTRIASSPAIAGGM